MNRNKLIVYVAVPVAISLILMAMYFSGNIVLQRIVSPKLPPLSPDVWREFGLLENLQNLTLLLIIGVACAGITRKWFPVEKVAWAVVAACALFVFLEEIDYGAHVKVYLAREEDFDWFLPAADWPPLLWLEMDLTARLASIHNLPGMTKVFKRAGDLLIAGLFVLLPLAAARIRNPWIKYFTPDRYAVLTVAAMVALRHITHMLGHMEEAAVEMSRASGDHSREMGSISKNLSEFRELNLYYLLLVYCADIVFLRQGPGERNRARPSATMT